MPKTPNTDWNHLDWINKFTEASKRGYGFQELRSAVFDNTIGLVGKEGYTLDGVFVKLEKCLPFETEFYHAKMEVIAQEKDTTISTINADCIEVGRLISQMGYHPCILNMASRRNPGGGAFEGSGAQEENIFRRSNLYTSLFQFVDYGKVYGIKRNPNFSYPLDKTHGAIYSPNVTVFRGSEHNGYCLLKTPFKLAFVTVPAISRPALRKEKDGYKIENHFVEPTKEKMRLILRVALSQQHDSIVLSAFGCGAYQNPPAHVAQLFHEVFEEIEFKNKLKLIVFAIIDDHNSRREHNPEGNVLPFLKEFE